MDSASGGPAGSWASGGGRCAIRASGASRPSWSRTCARSRWSGLKDSAFLENRGGRVGGAIDNVQGTTAAIKNATFVGNVALVMGGALLNFGMVTVENSELSGNVSGVVGGGIWNVGTCVIDNTNVDNNNAAEEGGGVWNGGALSIRNGKVTGNGAGLSGGGIFNFGDASLTLKNTSVTGNTPDDIAP